MPPKPRARESFTAVTEIRRWASRKRLKRKLEKPERFARKISKHSENKKDSRRAGRTAIWTATGAGISDIAGREFVKAALNSPEISQRWKEVVAVTLAGAVIGGAFSGARYAWNSTGLRRNMEKVHRMLWDEKDPTSKKRIGGRIAKVLEGKNAPGEIIDKINEWSEGRGGSPKKKISLIYTDVRIINRILRPRLRATKINKTGNVSTVDAIECVFFNKDERKKVYDRIDEVTLKKTLIKNVTEMSQFLKERYYGPKLMYRRIRLRKLAAFADRAIEGKFLKKDIEYSAFLEDWMLDFLEIALPKDRQDTVANLRQLAKSYREKIAVKVSGMR